MSYRGEFTWEPDEDRAQRMRIIGAVALLCAGWAVGFFSGRMSAWLFPVTDTQIVVMQNAPEPAAPSRAAEKPPAGPAAAPTATEPAPPAAPATQSAAAAQEPVPAAPPAKKDGDGTATPSVESEAASKVVQPEDADALQGKVTVINPDAGKQAPNAKAPARGREDRQPPAREPAVQPDELDRPAYGYQSPDQAAIAACERRYNSFRRSDGTYQPYNSPVRELCPLLR